MRIFIITIVASAFCAVRGYNSAGNTSNDTTALIPDTVYYLDKSGAHTIINYRPDVYRIQVINKNLDSVNW